MKIGRQINSVLGQGLTVYDDRLTVYEDRRLKVLTVYEDRRLTVHEDR